MAAESVAIAIVLGITQILSLGFVWWLVLLNRRDGKVARVSVKVLWLKVEVDLRDN